MIYNARTSEEYDLCELVENILMGKFPLARNTDRVQSLFREEVTYISYLTSKSNLRVGQTHFDLQLTGNICDILGIEINESYRRKGYGKKLYEVIEDLARYLDCKKIVTSSSGQGIPFWKSLGFSQTPKMMAEKLIA